MRRALSALSLLVAAALSLAACGSPGAGDAPASQGSSQPGSAASKPSFNLASLIDPSAGKYFGVEPSGPADSLAPVQAFATSAGRKPNLIGNYIAWQAPFDAKAAQNAWQYGAIYYLAWEPFSTTVAAIASGGSDTYITAFAEQVKASGVPVAISFGHEMNGNWYPWGTTGTSPADFVAAWRLIHALFATAGASNVIWVWNPNVISANDVPLEPYYPGDSYVNWIGITGYFPMTGAQTFTELFGPTMAEIRHFTAKPFIIAETSVQSGPAEVTCAKNLVSGVRHRSDVLGLVWFEFDKGGINWNLADRPQIRTAIARAISHLSLVNVRQL
jgi:mannan endo-1,4-beta-mannosidase